MSTHTVVIAVRHTATRQAARVNVTACAVITRVTEAISIVAHSVAAAVVRAEATLTTVKTGPFQIAQALSAIAKSVPTAVSWTPRAEQFNFQPPTLATVHAGIIEVAYAFSVNTIAMVAAIIRARDSTVTT